MRYMNNLCSLFTRISFVISHYIVRMTPLGWCWFPYFYPNRLAEDDFGVAMEYLNKLYLLHAGVHLLISSDIVRWQPCAVVIALLFPSLFSMEYPDDFICLGGMCMCCFCKVLVDFQLWLASFVEVCEGNSVRRFEKNNIFCHRESNYLGLVGTLMSVPSETTVTVDWRCDISVVYWAGCNCFL